MSVTRSTHSQDPAIDAVTENGGSGEDRYDVRCCAKRILKTERGALWPERSADVVEIADPRPVETVAFAGGTTRVGTTRPVIPEDGEGIIRKVELQPFAVDATPVTNARFAAFVAATGYITEAEKFGWGPVFRGLLHDSNAVPPSNSATPWWVPLEGAAWYAPEGRGSHVIERIDHPVTHVSWSDALAFAAWAGGRLPIEAEWEHAARGGLEDPRFPWGDQEPDDTDFLPCNIWQGVFPSRNTKADGWLGTSPVRAFAPNGAGLYDMVGNVWEWTEEPFLIASNQSWALRRNSASHLAEEKIMEGGSFLCHRSHCNRYRIAARSGTTADSGSSNTGFRVFYAT